MWKRTIALAAVLAVATTAAIGQQPLIFKKVDYYWIDGEDEKHEDARLVLDPATRTLTLSDEKRGADKRLYATIPYDNITRLTYEKSAHSRIKMGLLVSPLAFFMKGKKHWLTVEVEDLTSLPQGYVYARLDKNNFRQIIAALKGQTGLEVEEIIEQ